MLDGCASGPGSKVSSLASTCCWRCLRRSARVMCFEACHLTALQRKRFRRHLAPRSADKDFNLGFGGLQLFAAGFRKLHAFAKKFNRFFEGRRAALELLDDLLQAVERHFKRLLVFVLGTLTHAAAPPRVPSACITSTAIL